VERERVSGIDEKWEERKEGKLPRAYKKGRVSL